MGVIIEKRKNIAGTMLVFEEAQKRIEEVGCFSNKLEEVLLYLLKETQDIRETATKENGARKADIEKKCKDLERSFQDDSNRLKEIIKKENEERQRDMKDIEAYVKKENAERKKVIRYWKKLNLMGRRERMKQRHWRTK